MFGWKWCSSGSEDNVSTSWQNQGFLQSTPLLHFSSTSRLDSSKNCKQFHGFCWREFYIFSQFHPVDLMLMMVLTHGICGPRTVPGEWILVGYWCRLVSHLSRNSGTGCKLLELHPRMRCGQWSHSRGHAHQHGTCLHCLVWNLDQWGSVKPQ